MFTKITRHLRVKLFKIKSKYYEIQFDYYQKKFLKYINKGDYDKCSYCNKKLAENVRKRWNIVSKHNEYWGLI